MNMSLRANRSNLNSGVSLIIAIIFVSAFMLVMAGLFEARLRVIQAVGNREQEAKARYLAESAAELASYAAATHGAGWNLAEGENAVLEGELWAAARDIGISSCGAAVPGAGTQMAPCGRVQVIGRSAGAQTVQIAGAGSSYFSIPMAGTGNAGENCTSANASPDANHACNWNKLYVGQTVEILLYYVDDSGVVQKLDVNPAGDFLLRIRAAGGEELFPWPPEVSNPNYLHIEKDPVLVQWTISGTSIGPGGQVVGRTLVARDERQVGTKYRRTEDESHINTEISGGRINAAQQDEGFLNDLDNAIVLRKTDQGRNITSQGSRNAQAIKDFVNEVDNPILRLSLVGQPRRNSASGLLFNPDNNSHINNTDFDMPYLEYQLLTDSNNPVSDSKQIVIGWAEFGGFRKEVRREIQREPTLGGFVLEQF